MRLAISGFFQEQPDTGSGRYVISLTRALAEASTHEIVVLRPRWPGEAKPGNNPAAIHSNGESLAKASNPDMAAGVEASAGHSGSKDRGGQIETHWVPVPFKGNTGKLWFEQIGVPLAARRLGVDLLHVPYLGSPFLSSCPVVVTVHDLIMRILPAYRGSWAARSYTSLACASAKRANLIIADSRCTKDDITRLLRVAATKVRVVYLGCDGRYWQTPPANALVAVRQKYGLGTKFILYMGGFDSRKNVSQLIQAFARLGGNWELAIAGRPHSTNQLIYPALHEALLASGASDRIKLLGFVPEDDKQALYSVASLFAYPSLYEGFGLPPLEAMACGTPVVCSDRSSLPEVVGAAAALVDPTDCDAMVKCMRGILEDGQTAERMSQLARDQAKNFTWHRSAVQTLAVYDEVLSRGESFG